MNGFDGFGANSNIMSSIFPIIFVIFSVLILGVFIFAITYNVRRWRKNNASPVLTVNAKVVAKRTDVSGGSGDSSSWTRYYATFEFSSGDRMEFALHANEYAMLMENDVGNLTFQGTRYLDFERSRG